MANIQQRRGGKGGLFSFLTSCELSIDATVTPGIKSVLRDSLLDARDTKTRRPALLSELLLFSSPAVEGVVLGAELRHLHRRQVHRDGLRGQEGHRLRGQLLARWRRRGWSSAWQPSLLGNSGRSCGRRHRVRLAGPPTSPNDLHSSVQLCAVLPSSPSFPPSSTPMCQMRRLVPVSPAFTL